METQLFKCFIASPSDVQPERDACDSVFDEINKNIGKRFSVSIIWWRLQKNTFEITR